MKKVFLLFLVLLFGCSSSFDYSQIKVFDVIDGDTVILDNGKHLRLTGIDTPELKIKVNDEFVDQPQPFGLEAKSFLEDLVENKYVRIEFDKEKEDKYNRLLGYIFVGDNFVNEKIVEEGLAVVYVKPPNVKYIKRLNSAQNKARKKNKGLWGGLEEVYSDDAWQYINQIRTVKGRVKSSYRNEKALFLNFGYDKNTDFTAVIFNNCIYLFNRRGIEPEYEYTDRNIKVTGRIKQYNGPEIIVSTPEQVEIYNEE